MKTNILKNKKGEGFFSWFFVIIVLLAVAIALIVINKTYSEIQTPLQEGLSNSINDTENVNITKILNQTGSATLSFDKLLPFLIIGLFAFVLITAGAIIRHPIMIFVGIVILGVVILIAVIFSNVYTEISTTDAFSSTSASMPIQSKFMEYLPSIIFFIALGVVGSILWGKSQGGGSY